MIKRLQDYRWSYIQKFKKVLSDDNVISSPINAIRTMKIIELTHVCEIISYLKNDDDFISLKEEVKKYLQDNKKLILNSSIICPGVDTNILNSMTLELLNDELTEEEKTKLSSNRNRLVTNQRVLKKIKNKINFRD